MSTVYTPATNPTPEQDLPPPLPGNTPSATLPSDGDAQGVASIFPVLKQHADWLKWFSAVLNCRPPGSPAAWFGFSGVTHAPAVGAGTVVPKATSATIWQGDSAPVSVAVTKHPRDQDKKMARTETRLADGGKRKRK